MAVGDENNLNEELYHQLIGRYVSTIEVLTKRIFAKDQHIAKLETQMAHMEMHDPQEGDVKYEPPE